MSFLEAHKPQIERRHYYVFAGTSTHWFNFYRNVLNERITTYADDFCLVIDTNKNADDAYIIPYGEVKGLFTLPYLRGSRWIGNITKDYLLSISNAPLPTQETDVCQFHNAFELLQDAPKPLPKKPERQEYI